MMMKKMKRLLTVALVCVIAATFCVALTACGDDEPAGERTVASISVSKRPNKVEYNEGETFDPTGMELSVRYEGDDAATEKVTEGFTVDKTGPLTPDDTKVTVSYGGKTAVLNITVTANTATLEIVTLPDKLDYTSDKKTDLTGISVKASFASGKTETLDADDLDAKLTDDVVTVSYKGGSAAFTVKTGSQTNNVIGTQEWYSSTNEASLFGTWDNATAGDEDYAKLPAVDSEAGTVTFTDETYARLLMFRVKYTMDGVQKEDTNIAAKVDDTVDGQTFGYTMDVNANGKFDMGVLMVNKALHSLTDSNMSQMGIMLKFNGSSLELASTSGGGTDHTLCKATTSFENGKNNRLDIVLSRSEHRVTLKLYVNDTRVYFNDVDVAAHSEATLMNGNFTFMAGRMDTNADGYSNFGDRLGVYPASGTTVVLSDHKDA